MSKSYPCAAEITEETLTQIAEELSYPTDILEMEALPLLNNNRGAFITYEMTTGELPFVTGVVSKSLFDDRFTRMPGSEKDMFFLVVPK